jgi:hypothetical protein
MKAPENFAEKINGYKFTTKGEIYSLGYNMDSPNKVWIYPEGKSYIVTMLEFDWRKETFSINIAKTGEEEFFKKIPPNNFDARYFLSFDKFIKWMAWRADSMNHSIYNNFGYVKNTKSL